jgi:hypothetical protein
MMGPNDNARRLGHPSPLRWPSCAFVDLRWPSLAVIGLHWPSLAVVGHCWPVLARPALAVVGLQRHHHLKIITE